MDIRIVSKDFKVSDYIKELLDEKLNKFDKYFDNEVIVKITFGTDRENKKVKILIEAGSAIFRAEAKDKETRDALEQAIHRIESQMSKYKRKIRTKHFKESQRIKFDAFSDLPEETSVIDDFNIVREKKLELKPLNVEDAILDMEMLSHDFFVFINIENDNKISVVYKRRSGDYGILNA